MVTQTQTKNTKKPIPSIKEPPVVGSLLPYKRDRLDVFLRVTRECGDVGSFHFGPFPLVVFNTSEYAHSIFVEHAYDFDKGEVIHNAFRPVIGNGIFTSEGAFHRQQRKLIAPSFQPRQITGYADTMVKYSEQIQQGWKDGETVDISHEMTQLTMSIVGKVLFDADVFTEADELGSAMTTVLGHVTHTLSSLFPIPLSWPTSRNRHARQAIAVLRGRIQKMITEREASGEEGNDLLSTLLRAREEDGKRMSDEQISDESLTLFGAGHETTATALAWAWYLLATHPDVYRSMQQEVDSVLQGIAPTYADLARLPYTLQVFKETMRLYPPAYGISRTALRDIEIDGYFIPKNGFIAVCPYTLHRRPDYFPEPEKFDPQRFTPENEKRLPRYAYMPFGAGPRICIGNHFAMMEGHLLLAALAQQVTFELVEGQRIVPDPNVNLTIRPKYGVKMIVRRRARIG
ncbi:MAG TPA: cytochrome P450 [Ktedonobacteraceae bacterium]|nr:cytochrome P450 [Ktedonobacteraceae bacterium]